MNGLVLVFVIFILVNIASFVNFMYDDGFKVLFEDGAIGWREEIAFILFGIVGAFIALILNRKKPMDKAYKVVIPVVFVVETGTILYLVLFASGIIR